jgi:hypothetical protein
MVWGETEDVRGPRRFSGYSQYHDKKLGEPIIALGEYISVSPLYFSLLRFSGWQSKQRASVGLTQLIMTLA